MNKKCQLLKSLLKGDIINVSNSIHLTGYSNPGREIPREIERPFNVIISRNKVESKDQFGNYVMYYNYRFNPRIGENAKNIPKMAAYILEHDTGHKKPKTDKERKENKKKGATTFY